MGTAFSSINIEHIVENYTISMETETENQCSSDSSQSASGVDYSPTTYQCSTTKAFNDFIEKCEKPRVLEGSRKSDALEKFSQKQISEDDSGKMVVANNSSSGLEGLLMRVLMKTWIPTERIRKIVDYISSREEKLKPSSNARGKEEEQNCGFTNILAVESASSDENNSAMENYRFRQMRQQPGETFKALYGRLRAASSKCTFSASSRCNATDIAIRDQLLIAMNNHDLKQKALENNWNLEVLLKNGA